MLATGCRINPPFPRCTPSSPLLQIKDFWAVLESFDTAQRSLFLKFVWGRARLAVKDEAFSTPLKIQRLEKAASPAPPYP